MFSWFRKRRRRRLLAQSFPPEWLQHLQANVRHYGHLLPEEQQRLRRRVQVFVGEKTCVACGGMAIDDEVRVTIAAQACLLILGFPDDYCYDRLMSVLVYPGPYVAPARPAPDQIIVRENVPVEGEHWQRGPIVLSWEHVLAGGSEPGDGRNVVFHEFAHHLDGLDGAMDGIPPLESQAAYRRWQQVTEIEYRRLCRSADRQRATLLDQYGATSRAEFFAVATECFFQRPGDLHRRHPELFDVLRQFYRQDPEPWFARASVGRPTAAELEARYEAGVLRCVEEMRLDPRSADGHFTAGVVHARNGRHDRAVQCLTAAIELAPHDAEAFRQRAKSLLELGQTAQALADCQRALHLDPADPHAWRAQAEVRQRLGDQAGAAADQATARQLEQGRG